MNVLIIGYGSIGKRHEEVLSSFNNIEKIDIISKQNLENKTVYRSLEDVKFLDEYDYFVIASETNKHFQQLVFLDHNVKGKIFFCEKPLFDKKEEIHILNNKVFVGYVLRFHPLIKKLKEFLVNDTILNVNISCGQYLPTWRPNSDYRDCYSAKKDQGGGVLLDLSHEIDYAQWLYGDIIELKSYQLKISDLEIDSDDYTTFIAKTNQDILINLTIDYISKITHRKMHINTLNNTFELDFIVNKLVKKDKVGLEEIYSFSKLERNYMFNMMHNSILNNGMDACSLDEGLSTMNTIGLIQEQNI